MMTVITEGIIVLKDRLVKGKNLLIQNGKIEGISDSIPPGYNVFSAGGKYVAPGFIDLHSHGAGGFDFMDGTQEAIKGACLTHMMHGTTTISPTTLTCPLDELFLFFEQYRKVKEEWKEGPNLAGIHLEGPFFSPAQAGAQDPKYLKNPTKENYMPILEMGGKDISRMSVAVELDGALELGDELARRGIIAAIGHSDATYSDIIRAIDHGYSHITHLYSGMSSLHRVGPYRVLGVIESSYLFDSLTVEIIADGKHLPPELLQLILKCKGIDKSSLITDSMRGAAMKEGEQPILGSLHSGQKTIIKDGVAMMPDLHAFAGSVCTSNRCIYTMYKLVGIPLYDAVRMMTLNPAKILGLSEKKGSIASGYDADIIIFDDNISIDSVFINGSLKYRSQ